MNFLSETCTDCLQTYWACSRCGHSPMGGIHASESDRPKHCQNLYCGSTDLVFKRVRICCKRTWHHIYTTCEHCGQEG